MTHCTLNYDFFAEKVAGDAYLNADFSCRVCGKLAGQHPARVMHETVDAEERQRKKARSSSPTLEIGPAHCNVMLTVESTQVPENGTTTCMKLPRAKLVARVIELVETTESRAVYIRGGPGAGKSVLLALVGQELARQKKHIVSIPDARDLQSGWGRIVDMTKSGPVYLLVDEIHTAMNSSVWKYLKQPLHMRPLVYTIAAGIPDETQPSAMFREHTDVEEIFLELEELEAQHVVDYFATRLQQALQHKQLEQNAPPGLITSLNLREAALQVLRFAHSYTQGHAYPCLKLAEYFVTQASARCVEQNAHTALLAVVASVEFSSTVFKAIYNCCYGQITSDTAAQLLFAVEESAEADKAYIELTRLGLWHPMQGMSLMLQYTVMHRYGPAAQVTLPVSYENFGEVLMFALRTLTDVQFSQLRSISDIARQHCEDGINLFIGARLNTINGLYLSPQHALPVPDQPGRSPSVDFYINGTLDMCLALTRNGSLLEKHFQRFQAGGPHEGKRFVLLDIELNRAHAPTPLPEALRMYEQVRYTYVVRLNTLYRGTTVFNTEVRPLKAFMCGGR